MISERVMVFSLGATVEYTMVTGEMGSSMVVEFLLKMMGLDVLGPGKKDATLNGLTNPA